MTIKNDEILLYAALRKRTGRQYICIPRDALLEEAAVLGMHQKRMTFLLFKWCGKGYTNYGVSSWSSWFTPEAPDSLGEIKPEKPMDVLRRFDGIGNF